jgi:hypothetical protein
MSPSAQRKLSQSKTRARREGLALRFAADRNREIADPTNQGSAPACVTELEARLLGRYHQDVSLPPIVRT